MAKKNDAAARAARARLLRMQIEGLVSKETVEGERAPGAAPEKESPAEFVERRMREIEVEKRKRKKGTGARKPRSKRS